MKNSVFNKKLAKLMRLANDKYKFAPELMWLTGAGHIAGRSWHTKPPAMDAERAAARAGLLARGEPSVLVMQALAAVGNPQPVATVGDTSIYPDGSLWDRRRREIWHDTHDYCSCLRALDVRDTENYSRMRAYLCFRRGKDDKSAAEAASSIPLAELEQMGLSVVKPSPPELWEESGTLVAWPVKVPIDIGAAPQSPNAGDDNHLDGEDDVGPF